MGRKYVTIHPSYAHIKECSGCSGRLMKYQLWFNLHCSWANFTSLPLNINFYNHWSTAFLELAWEGFDSLLKQQLGFTVIYIYLYGVNENRQAAQQRAVPVELRLYIKGPSEKKIYSGGIQEEIIRTTDTQLIIHYCTIHKQTGNKVLHSCLSLNLKSCTEEACTTSYICHNINPVE